ncbi:hypothetical protein [uncultured Chryseobacterium sp.]|uniref:hypothetical protein n=1 Tax=uncultured Chryseobacterium sp. TaxID=259322 RepID=UPI0025F7062A|nr:hypothetical protein [uncultured Chryseobacterium sp.]
MSKVPFTPDGVQQKQDEIYSLSPDEIAQVAHSVANETVNWITENFTMSDEQAAYLESLPQQDLRIMGWGLASAIIGKLPISMQDPTPPPSATAAKKSKEVEIDIHTEHNPNTGTTTINGGVIFRWKWN